MKNKKKLIIITAVPIGILLYILSCIILFFFEPVSYNAPDLSNAYSFELYEKFSKEKNDEFYIKQITYSDVIAAPDDLRLKFIDNTILIIADETADYASMSSLFKSVGGEICGYIEDARFYQIEFDNKTYNELQNICSMLNDNKYVRISLIDYFEETPTSDSTTDLNAYGEDYYYLDVINAYEAWALADGNSNPVTVGVFDVPVFYSNKNLNVINQGDYSTDVLSNSDIKKASSHGTHVAGIIGASAVSDARGICSDAGIYSENAVNNSVSYWLASLANMIINENIKIINISMGYNSYIPVSATLGCESSINFVNAENEFFEAFFDVLIENNYDYLLCISAGNETGASLYKTDSDIFSYGEKDLLRKLDFFDFCSVKPEYCNADYQLSFTSIDDEDVRSRIMIVGSCDYFKEYSDFASAGASVDIVAPGEGIYSTGFNAEYMYMSGTSMSAPFVAGSAALLYSLDSTLTCPEIKQLLLTSSTETVAAYGFEYPLLNVGNAVEFVLSE